jgi:outer membrane lipoprotein-sorting protein
MFMLCVVVCGIAPQLWANGTGSTTPVLPAKKISPASKNPSASNLDAETKLVLTAVSERYRKFRIWEATFTQETFSVGLGSGTFNQGEFKFQFPKKFKYSLISPEASDIISDGKNFWQISFKEGREKPAFVRETNDLSKIDIEKYLILLRGIDTLDPKNEAKLLKDFAISGKSIQDELYLTLEPKKSGEIIRITMIFKQTASALYRAILEDAVGNKTTITLTNHKIQKSSFGDEVFKPKYPKNSKVEKL